MVSSMVMQDLSFDDDLKTESLILADVDESELVECDVLLDSRDLKERRVFLLSKEFVHVSSLLSYSEQTAGQC